VDLHEIPRLKPIQSKVIIGNLGKLVEQKGHIHLIEVAKVLKNKEIQFEIHIAGTGPMKEKLNTLIKKEGLSDEVKLLGNIENMDFLNSIDIFVFPSLFEGLSNVMLEAQLYQKPTVAFNTASNYEVITHGYNGLLIPPFNTNLMANALYTLSKSNLMQNWFQKNSLNILNEKFNQKRMTSKLEELLEL
jgi:glycosyltransferase involved in cell wall biosynthesis